MTVRDLPASGTIKLSEVKAEFGKGNNLLDYLGEGGVTSSAPLKLTDFYGTSAVPPPLFDGATEMPGFKRTYEYNGYPDRVTGYNTSRNWQAGHRTASSQSSTLMLADMLLGRGTYIISYVVTGGMRNEFTQNAEFAGFSLQWAWRKANFESDKLSGVDPNVYGGYPPVNGMDFCKWPGWPNSSSITQVQGLDGNTWVEYGEYRQAQTYQLTGSFPVTLTDTYTQFGMMTMRPGINQWMTFDTNATQLTINPSTRQADIDAGIENVERGIAETTAAIAEFEAMKAEEE